MPKNWREQQTPAEDILDMSADGFAQHLEAMHFALPMVLRLPKLLCVQVRVVKLTIVLKQPSEESSVRIASKCGFPDLL